jgi:hypothetical protein
MSIQSIVVTNEPLLMSLESSFGYLYPDFNLYREGMNLSLKRRERPSIQKGQVITCVVLNRRKPSNALAADWPEAGACSVSVG